MSQAAKKKNFITDSMWSILALGIMNVVTQFLLYPVLRNVLGAEEYGNVLYLISIINIMATTIGCSANLARLVASVRGKTWNIDSMLWLLALQLLMLPVCIIVMKMGGYSLTAGSILLTWLLAGATIWRNYADVEYRLSTNYKGYFYYYLLVTLGYLVGIGVFWLTGIWQLILLPGELAGLIFVWRKGTILLWEHNAFDRERFRFYLRSVFSLAMSQLLVNVVLNADRLVLKNMLGGEAVTVYYVASQIGKTIALITSPLNSVIIGHLAKSQDNLSEKSFLKLGLLGIGLTMVTLLACVVGANIFAKLLYPQEYQAAQSLFWTANLAQILYFATGILMTVLLRYIRESYQVMINSCFVAAFAVLTIVGTLWGGLGGFAVGLLITNALRYLLTMVVGTVQLRKLNRESKGDACA